MTAVLSSTSTRRRGDQWRTKPYVKIREVSIFRNERPTPPYFGGERDDLWVTKTQQNSLLTL
jgi:hypothetical protein